MLDIKKQIFLPFLHIYLTAGMDISAGTVPSGPNTAPMTYSTLFLNLANAELTENMTGVLIMVIIVTIFELDGLRYFCGLFTM